MPTSSCNFALVNPLPFPSPPKKRHRPALTEWLVVQSLRAGTSQSSRYSPELPPGAQDTGIILQTDCRKEGPKTQDAASHLHALKEKHPLTGDPFI